MNRRKEVKEFVRDLHKRYGIRSELRPSGHIALLNAEGKPIYAIGATPSDRRWKANALKHMKRLGLLSTPSNGSGDREKVSPPPTHSPVPERFRDKEGGPSMTTTTKTMTASRSGEIPTAEEMAALRERFDAFAAKYPYDRLAKLIVTRPGDDTYSRGRKTAVELIRRFKRGQASRAAYDVLSEALTRVEENPQLAVEIREVKVEEYSTAGGKGSRGSRGKGSKADGKTHVCSICGKEYPSAQARATHETQHRTFDCPVCDLTITTPAAYAKHMRSVHGQQYMTVKEEQGHARAKEKAKALTRHAQRVERVRAELIAILGENPSNHARREFMAPAYEQAREKGMRLFAVRDGSSQDTHGGAALRRFIRNESGATAWVLDLFELAIREYEKEQAAERAIQTEVLDAIPSGPMPSAREPEWPTEAEIEQMADEAERGYEPAELTPRSAPEQTSKRPDEVITEPDALTALDAAYEMGKAGMNRELAMKIIRALQGE